MAFVSSVVGHLAIARMLFVAIAAPLSAIAVLLCFIIGRRWWRARYFARRDALARFFRQHWNELLTGIQANGSWPSGALASEVVESMLLDRIEVANAEELPALAECLRRTGILDRRVNEARYAIGWRRQAALVALGRTRSPEAVPALAGALDAAEPETRIAAARGLGKIARPPAAKPLLDRIVGQTIDVPWGILKNALLTCCAAEPEMLMRYLRVATGTTRELLARVLSEIADGANCDELLVMSGDPSAELRCSAARALARATPDIAIPALAQLASDAEWFVRLRAVVALGNFVERGGVPILVRSLGDRNRLVRQRAAWALIRSRSLVPDVVRDVVNANDNYGLQAVVAELDRSGLYRGIVEELRHRAADAERLVTALERGRLRLSSAEPIAVASKVGAA